MGDRRASDDRLPWLDAPPARTPPSPAPSRRAPLMLLLALFLAGGIAVIAFLAGRTSAPRPVPPPPAPVEVRVPAPVATPAPVTPRPVAPPAGPRPAASSPPPVPRPATRPPARPDRRGMIPPIERAFARAKPAAAAPRPRPVEHQRPVARGPAGVVQLGAYVTTPLLEASWARLVGAYPRLATLPRSVTVTQPAPGRPRYWRLRVLTTSRREARALCDRLHAIGRGCMVVARAK